MSRAVPLAVLLLTAPAASAVDLPPGALVRLGDDHFRAGDAVYHLVLSPDGKRYATARRAAGDTLALTVWDAATGRSVCDQRVNRDLFRGFVWGPSGAFAIATRTEPAPKGQRGRIVPNDFCVWDFTDPSAAPPVLPPSGIIERISGSIPNGPTKPAPEYTRFLFSADGKRVAVIAESVDDKFAVHVFELKPAATATKLVCAGTVDLGAEGAGAVRVSADGKTLVTFRELANSDALTATDWDVATGKPGRPVLVSSAAEPSSDGKKITRRLMLAPDARSLVLHAAEEKEWGFDVFPLTSSYKGPSGKRVQIRSPHVPLANEVRGKAGASDGDGYAFFPSGTILVVATPYHRTLVIDLISGKELGRLEGHSQTPDAIAVSADGTRIATADLFGLVRLWDAKTFRPLHDAPGHRQRIEHAELSPDGKHLLTWAPDETVRLWDVATGTELRAFTGAPARSVERPNRPTFTPDGTTILFSTKDRLIARDLLTKLEVPLAGDLAKLKPGTAVFAPDGKAVLIQTDDDPPVAVYDWPSGKKRFELSEGGPVRLAGFSPDGTVLFTDACSGERWDAKTGKELPPAWPDAHRNDLHPLFSLRSHPPLVRVARGEEVRVIEAGTGKPVPHSRSARAAGGIEIHAVGSAFSPYGEQFATTHRRDENEILLCEAATGQVRRTLRGHRGEARVLGFTPDGTKLLTAGGDHTVLVWDMRLKSVPLPDAIKQETSAAKLWNALAADNAHGAYLAMSRLAREPGAAVTIAKQRMKPAVGDDETDATNRTDARGIELLEALGTDEARSLIKELAGGRADAFRTQEAKRALERNTK